MTGADQTDAVILGHEAEWLRDQRLSFCEHFDTRGVISDDPGLRCCSPCLRDRLLAAGWLPPTEVARRVEAEYTAGEIPQTWFGTAITANGVLLNVIPVPSRGEPGKGPLILEIRVERNAIVRRQS